MTAHNGKTALVTGAGDGIGKGIALELAKAGYDVFIHSATNFAKAQKLCDEITSAYGRKTSCVQADLLEADAPEKIFAAFDKSFARLDLYVNNAGITEGAPFLKMTRETVDRVININLKGAFFCAQEAAKRMIRNDGSNKGNIVIITSNQQEYIMPTGAIYGPVKSALNRLSKHIALELAPYGIRVNAIVPGYVDSTERMHTQRPGNSYDHIPLRRWAEVEEVGQAVLYLDSDAAAFITGSSLVMDGGATIQHLPQDWFKQQ